ncbi:MAG TPA: GatB/YqeY domain-containing protein [Alphaproteobacteria bacterium]|nr:GatB/YqeY domain-containing protein [Alphaproteobacteria bacterium]
MREKLRDDMKAAMKAKETRRLSTIRLMLAAIQERDNAAPNGKIPDEEIPPVLTKMVRQRKESLETYEKAGREDLAKVEREEILIIESYLPKQMSEPEVRTAIAALVKEIGATSPKDMGKVMGALKARFSGQMDMAKANGIVKELLTPQ